MDSIFESGNYFIIFWIHLTEKQERIYIHRVRLTSMSHNMMSRKAKKQAFRVSGLVPCKKDTLLKWTLTFSVCFNIPRVSITSCGSHLYISSLFPERTCLILNSVIKWSHSVESLRHRTRRKPFKLWKEKGFMKQEKFPLDISSWRMGGSCWIY